jgi:hypothetical protein
MPPIPTKQPMYGDFVGWTNHHNKQSDLCPRQRLSSSIIRAATAAAAPPRPRRIKTDSSRLSSSSSSSKCLPSKCLRVMEGFVVPKGSESNQSWRLEIYDLPSRLGQSRGHRSNLFPSPSSNRLCFSFFSMTRFCQWTPAEATPRHNRCFPRRRENTSSSAMSLARTRVGQQYVHSPLP